MREVHLRYSRVDDVVGWRGSAGRVRIMKGKVSRQPTGRGLTVSKGRARLEIALHD